MKQILQLLLPLMICQTIMYAAKPQAYPAVHAYITEKTPYGDEYSVIACSDKSTDENIQTIQFKNCLMYFLLKDGELMEVYQKRDVANNRKAKWQRIYESPRSTRDYSIKVKQVIPEFTGDLPDYTILSISSLMAGGGAQWKHANLLVPSMNQYTPIEEKKAIAYEILRIEPFHALNIYFNSEAYERSSNKTYAHTMEDPNKEWGKACSINRQGKFTASIPKSKIY